MSDHPVSDVELMAYAFGELDAGSALATAAHVGRCPHCAARLATFDLVRAAVRADAALVPSDKALARINRLITGRARTMPERKSAFASLKQRVATVVFDGRSALALSGLRGGTTAYVIRYALDELDVDLEIEPAGGDEWRWQVTGQISASEPTGRLALAITEPGSLRPILEVETDDDGIFFADVTTGSYDVLIRVADGLVVVPNLEVG